MITFDVTWETLRYVIGIDLGALYYKDEETSIELYYVQNNNVMLHYTYNKQGPEEDLIWMDDNLKKAIKIIRLKEKQFKFQILQE